MKQIFKNYRIGFDVWALVLFLIIMVPNFIWFAIPAPKDIMRVESLTTTIDTVGSICQALMIGSLCFVVRRDKAKLKMTGLIMAVMGCCLIYFVSWIFYYTGMTNAVAMLGLTVPPCLAFLLFAVNRKNMVALVPTVAFTICHLLYSFYNYIILHT